MDGISFRGKTSLSAVKEIDISPIDENHDSSLEFDTSLNERGKKCDITNRVRSSSVSLHSLGSRSFSTLPTAGSLSLSSPKNDDVQLDHFNSLRNICSTSKTSLECNRKEDYKTRTKVSIVLFLLNSYNTF